MSSLNSITAWCCQTYDTSNSHEALSQNAARDGLQPSSYPSGILILNKPLFSTHSLTKDHSAVQLCTLWPGHLTSDRINSSIFFVVQSYTMFQHPTWVPLLGVNRVWPAWPTWLVGTHDSNLFYICGFRDCLIGSNLLVNQTYKFILSIILSMFCHQRCYPPCGGPGVCVCVCGMLIVDTTVNIPHTDAHIYI